MIWIMIQCWCMYTNINITTYEMPMQDTDFYNKSKDFVCIFKQM